MSEIHTILTISAIYLQEQINMISFIPLKNRLRLNDKQQMRMIVLGKKFILGQLRWRVIGQL